MDRQQQEKARRVWQRVNGQAQSLPVQKQERSELQEELSVSALLRQLVQTAAGENKQLLRQLYVRQQNNITVLKGLEKLQSVQHSTPGERLPDNLQFKQILYLAWGKNQGLISRYSRQIGSEQWGYVYAHLLEQKKEQNILLLRLLAE